MQTATPPPMTSRWWQYLFCFYKTDKLKMPISLAFHTPSSFVRLQYIVLIKHPMGKQKSSTIKYYCNLQHTISNLFRVIFCCLSFNKMLKYNSHTQSIYQRWRFFHFTHFLNYSIFKYYLINFFEDYLWYKLFLTEGKQDMIDMKPLNVKEKWIRIFKTAALSSTL